MRLAILFKVRCCKTKINDVQIVPIKQGIISWFESLDICIVIKNKIVKFEIIINQASLVNLLDNV